MPEIESTSKPEQELPKKKEEEPVRTSASDKKPQPEYKINNPILASQVEKRQMKIAKLEDKNTVLSQKIAKNETKIEKQQAKIEDAQKTKAYCKTLLESAALPKPLQVFFQSMMDRQESRIKNCNNKISKLQNKNNGLTQKINSNKRKIAKHTVKIESLQKVDQFLTNMQSREGRRENFVQAVSEFQRSSLERSSVKSSKLQSQIAQKETALTKATSSVEKVQLRNQIAKLQVTLSSVNERINKLNAMAAQLDRLAALPADQADKVIDNAVKGVDQQLSADQSMTVQETTDTVVNEAGKAVNNNDIEQQGLDKEQETIAKLNGEISDDLAFFGEVTYETAQHIKEAGYELKGDTLQKAATEKAEEHKEVNQQEHSEKQNETHTEKQAKTALDVAALCAAIPIAFAENHDMQTRLVHTTAVFTALAESFNFDDVKSAVAIGIMDRKEDTAISDQAKAWASKLPLTDTLKSFADTKGSLPLDIKSGYLDVFAKKVDSWEQSRQEKSPAAMSRKDIIGSKPKEHEAQKQQPQHDKAQPKKNDPSL